MTKCVNENCKNDPDNSPDKLFWGPDGDAACNQHCYDEANKQRDNFCSEILPNDEKLAQWWKE